MAEVIRRYELGDIGELPVLTNTDIEEGVAVGVTVAGGLARPVDPTDKFAGFAEATVLNNPGNSGAKTVRVIERGKVKLSVTNAAITNFGAPVYADGPNVFTLDPADGPFVGYICRFISSGVVIVRFDAALTAPAEES